MNKKKWGLGFGIGSFFAFIIVLFIFLYSRDQHQESGETGWYLLKVASQIYLWISGVLIGLAILMITFGLVAAIIVHYRVKRTMKKMNDDVIDANYRLKK
jgi:MFS family permease